MACMRLGAHASRASDPRLKARHPARTDDVSTRVSSSAMNGVRRATSQEYGRHGNERGGALKGRGSKYVVLDRSPVRPERCRSGYSRPSMTPVEPAQKSTQKATHPTGIYPRRDVCIWNEVKNGFTDANNGSVIQRTKCVTRHHC